MKVEKSPEEKSSTKLTIELSVEEFLPFIEKAGKKVANSMDIPGFRKGQAPLDVVKQRVGEMTVLQEASELAVRKILPEAIKSEGLDTVGHPEINIEKLAPDNPLVFTAIVPLLPDVELGDIDKLSAKKDSLEVNETEINKVIDNLRKMRASEVLVEREAKQGDKVEVKFNVYLNKVPIDGGSNDKYPLTLGDGSMIPGFEEKIEGMKKDEEKEFELEFPSEYHNKHIAGKMCEFKVALLAVYEVTPPELNDEWAKSMGDYDSVDALKDAVEKNIFEEKKQKVEGMFERDIMDGMIDLTKFGDIPDSMINSEIHSMMHELEQNIAGQGLNFDDYLTHLKKDRNQLKLDFTPDAVRRIKSALIIKTMAKEKNIEATEEEFAEELDRLRHAYESNPKVLEEIEAPSYKEYLKTVVRNRKTLHWIVEQVEKK